MGYPACLYDPVSYPARRQHSSPNTERNLRNSPVNRVGTSAANNVARYTIVWVLMGHNLAGWKSISLDLTEENHNF